MRSSEGAKAAVEAQQRAAMLELQVEQLRLRMERAEKIARVATEKVAALRAEGAAATAEASALFSGNWRNPRLSFKGKVLARSLNEKGQKKCSKRHGGPRRPSGQWRGLRKARRWC
jgi:hypothetical protein